MFTEATYVRQHTVVIITYLRCTFHLIPLWFIPLCIRVDNNYRNSRPSQWPTKRGTKSVIHQHSVHLGDKRFKSHIPFREGTKKRLVSTKCRLCFYISNRNSMYVSHHHISQYLPMLATDMPYSFLLTQI